MSEKLKVGIIGCNLELRAALPFWELPRDRTQITAVADSNPVMLQRVQEKYPEEHFVCLSSADELICRDDVEAVFIMVRDCFHEEMAIRALKAGKAVYLEKPMAITLEGCDRILKTAYETGSKLFIGHNMRYMPFVRKMKEIIDSGVIGKVQAVWCRHFVAYGSCYFRDWCSEQKNCTGLLLQKGAHDIDVIQWLAGAPAVRVTAMGQLSVYNQTVDRLNDEKLADRKIAFTNASWPPLELKGLRDQMDVEDHNMILMQLANGVQACYMHCMYTPDAERNYTFIGTKGRIENIGNGEEGTQIHVWTQRGSRQKPDIVYHLHAESGGHGGADFSIVPAFVRFVMDGEVPDVSPVDARNAVAAGYSGHFSMRNGSIPVEIPPVPQEWQEYFANGQKR